MQVMLLLYLVNNEYKQEYDIIEDLPSLINPNVNVRWIGGIVNSYPQQLALIFYTGKWDGKLVVDFLLQDILTKKWSPFNLFYEKAEKNRDKFTQYLHGGIAHGDPK